MAKVNREWHSKNKVPKKPSTKQRMKWHSLHAKECGCRPIPNKLQKIISK